MFKNQFRKYAPIFSGLLILVILAFASPRAYERFHPTDDQAAIGLNELPLNMIGQTVVECLNDHNRDKVWWDWNDVASLEAHQDLGGSWNASYYIMSGRLGRHSTWMAVLSLSSKYVIAYDVYGAKGFEDGLLFNRALPVRVIGSLKRCGVVYRGVYPDELFGKFIDSLSL